MRTDFMTRRLSHLAAAACAGLSLCGCAGFWDEVTSRDFKVKQLFVQPDPLVVLRDSNDGDARAKALLALQEPKQHGGSDQEQDAILKILSAAATTERQPLCRLAAIETLGHFKDPRAVQSLKDAFYNAGSFPRSKRSSGGLPDVYASLNTIPLDVPTRIQCEALTALGKTRNPAAVDLLTLVVRSPQGEGADLDKQQVLDVRMSAARALANFNQRQAADALVYVLQNDQDVALRERAYKSLQASTGWKLPPDAKAWQAALQHPEQRPPEPDIITTVKNKVLDWSNQVSQLVTP